MLAGVRKSLADNLILSTAVVQNMAWMQRHVRPTTAAQDKGGTSGSLGGPEVNETFTFDFPHMKRLSSGRSPSSQEA